MSNHARRRHSKVTKAAGASGSVLALGAALVAATPGTAGAAEIQVTSAADDNGAGVTLREAIVQANSTVGVDDLITFAPALNGQTITLAMGEIDITDGLEIRGPGASLLTVAGSGSARIFDVGDSDFDLTVSGLTLTDGDTTGGGGAIYTFNKGSVTLTNLHVTGNEAGSDGGGVVIWDAASATVTGSTFDDNDAGGKGGGLHVYDVEGAVTLTGNTFDQNYADEYGGGVALYRNDGPVTVSGTFTANGSTKGGGISIEDTHAAITITGSTIADNVESSYGGGVFIGYSDDVTIATTTISGNSVDESGGGIFVYETDSLTIDRSTISGNYASVDGGGIYSYGTEVEIVSSTISGNEAQGDGGGIFFAYEDSSEPASLTIAHSTVTLNDADEGGGLYLGNANATIDHTIIAGNPTGGDVEGGGTADLSNSLIGDADLGGVTINPGGTNNELGVADAGLAALANNGGPTMTHALLADSPALNSGDPAFAAPPATDQRGEARVAFEVIDKGAYEAQPDEPEPEPPAAQPVEDTPDFTG